MKPLLAFLLLATAATAAPYIHGGTPTTPAVERACYVAQLKLTYQLAARGEPDAWSAPIGSDVWVPAPSAEWKAFYRRIHGREWRERA